MRTSTFPKILVGLAIAAFCAQAQPSAAWTLVRSEHFEIYSQAGEAPARSALLWFEQLRAFFLQQTKLKLIDRGPVRVLGFRSQKEYAPYRLRPTSDAYYVGTGSRNYIVVPSLGADSFGLAAHEYAHLVLHANGLRFAPWLDEGLAEFLSSLRISDAGSVVGAEVPARVNYLRHHSWMPLRQLLTLPNNSPLRDVRDSADLFYSESWALTNMLLLSPDYAPEFPKLVGMFDAGVPAIEGLPAIYGKSLEIVAAECKTWIDRPRLPAIAFSGVAPGDYSQTVSDVSPRAAQLIVAELLLSDGDLGKAEFLYNDLDRKYPPDAGVKAGLGTIAVINRQYDLARELWRQAVELGVDDAALCLRYAQMAQSANLSTETIRPALERAVALKPEFDDARFQLALLERAAGNEQAALDHLQRMKDVPRARAFGYWTALSSTLTELDRREEAEEAARQAALHATSSDQEDLARQLRYLAKTDLTVRFSRDRNGRAQLETARMTHNQKDWNPFIEPTDSIRHVKALLRGVGCTAGAITSVEVDADGHPLTLTIPDPLHVQVMNQGAGLTCGPQTPSTVTIDYATSDGRQSQIDGIVRGLAFDKP